MRYGQQRGATMGYRRLAPRPSITVVELGQYEASFRQNEVNESVLPKLTQEDLKEIGVGPVGHRRIRCHRVATR
jgi:hypothetical protein